jgi:hypothetical protein
MGHHHHPQVIVPDQPGNESGVAPVSIRETLPLLALLLAEYFENDQFTVSED